jgi:hypothetical protein
MAITSTQLTTTSSANVFTAVGQQAITVMYLCNTTANATLVNMYVTSAVANAAANNQIYSALEITANDTYVISNEKLILDTGYLIRAIANVANNITVTVSSISV